MSQFPIKISSIETEIITGVNVITKLQAGVNKISDLVKLTLGPSGQCVVIERINQKPHVTKDGVTVARAVTFKDTFENLGLDLVREASLKTLEDAGDGTTSSIVMAQSMLNWAVKTMKDGFSFKEVSELLDQYESDVISSLSTCIHHIDTTSAELKNIATNALNGEEEVAELVCDAFRKVSQDGVVMLSDFKPLKSYLEHKEGLFFDKGYPRAQFINDRDKGTVDFHNAYVFLSDDYYVNLVDIEHILNIWVEEYKTNGRPLLLIVQQIMNDCLAAIVKNVVKGGFPICVVEAPYEGVEMLDFLKDIGALTKGRVFSLEQRTKLKSFTVEDFGSCERVIIDAKSTTILNSKTPSLEERVAYLKGLEGDNEQLRERIAKLTNGSCIIHVGGANDIEQKERKDRVDDAVNAVKGALKEGVVAGVGYSYVHADFPFSSCIRDFLLKTVDENLLIGDPYKVVRTVIKNSVAVVKTIISSGGLVGCPLND